MSKHCLLFWFYQVQILNARAATCELHYQLLAQRLRGPRLVKV